MACSPYLGPGYEFDLFEKSQNWPLARAIESENEKEIKKLLNYNSININLQEPKFGVTLLHLAVGNDELISTRILLEAGADLNIRDSSHRTAIHEAANFIELKQNSFQTLELLLKHGANVNDTLVRTNTRGDTTYFFVPLMGTSSNLECTKLLLNHGANLYIKHDNVFYVWAVMLANDLYEGIFLLKYLIVDKQLAVPNPISYSAPDNGPLDIFHFLNKQDLKGDLRKEKAMQEILNYLEIIGFPKKGVYRE